MLDVGEGIPLVTSKVGDSVIYFTLVVGFPVSSLSLVSSSSIYGVD